MGCRLINPPSLFLTDRHFCQGIFSVVMKWRKCKACPGLEAPGAGRALGPGRLEIPAHGRSPFVDPAGYPSARRAPQSQAPPFPALAHGPAEGIHPDGQAGGDAPLHGVVCLGPVEGCPQAHATGPAAQTGVLPGNLFPLSVMHVAPRSAAREETAPYFS